MRVCQSAPECTEEYVVDLLIDGTRSIVGLERVFHQYILGCGIDGKARARRKHAGIFVLLVASDNLAQRLFVQSCKGTHGGNGHPRTG